MGYSLSLLAARGKPSELVLDSLGLRRTGQFEQHLAAPISGVELPTGWYLIIARRSGHKLIRPFVLAQASRDREIVTLDVEEHVMVSVAAGWKNGKHIWRIEHDGQRGTDHLQTEGELPPMFPTIRDTFFLKHRTRGNHDADVDYLFEIPVELVRTVTGFRHDEELPSSGDNPFEVLIVQSKKLSLLSRLFGE